MIYISHPYQGKEENKQSVERIIRELIKEYPNETFISPIHTFGFLYFTLTYEQGLQLCLNLLSKCKEIWLCPGWIESRGCLAEREEAYRLGIPIKEIF